VTEDLRGLQQDDVDGDESWYSVTSVLRQLVTVTALYLGSCPASVVHAVADQMLWLQRFSVDNVVGTPRYADGFAFLVAVVL